MERTGSDGWRRRAHGHSWQQPAAVEPRAVERAARLGRARRTHPVPPPPRRASPLLQATRQTRAYHSPRLVGANQHLAVLQEHVVGHLRTDRKKRNSGGAHQSAAQPPPPPPNRSKKGCPMGSEAAAAAATAPAAPAGEPPKQVGAAAGGQAGSKLDAPPGCRGRGPCARGPTSRSACRGRGRTCGGAACRQVSLQVSHAA